MLIDKNLKHAIDHDYDIERYCEHSGCKEDPSGACRCSKIINTTITDINVSKISKDIFDLYFSDDHSTKRDYKLKKIIYGYDKHFDIYVIDRIIRYYRIWDSSSYDIKIFKGFYGEEIDSINIKPGIALKISDKIEEILGLESIKERIEALLLMEYGYLIPEMIDKDYEIIEVDKVNIHFGNRDHHNKVKEKVLEFYSNKNYNGIRGVVHFDGDKYRVIDGYHRIHTTSSTKIKVINVK